MRTRRHGRTALIMRRSWHLSLCVDVFWGLGKLPCTSVNTMKLEGQNKSRVNFTYIDVKKRRHICMMIHLWP